MKRAGVLLLAIIGCADSVGRSTLIGRWRIVEGVEGTVEFMDDGQAIWANREEQYFATYRVISPSKMIIVEFGDSVLVDYDVRGDTLYYSPMGLDQEFAAVRVNR